MQAKLPKHLETHLVGDMKNGEYGYSVPWAMNASNDGTLWLDNRNSIHSTPSGTATMLISVVNGNYVVDVSGCGNYTWSRAMFSITQGFNLSRYSPVALLIE